MALSMPMWVIYDHPSDYPDSYVAREHLVEETGSRPTENVVMSNSLELLRTMMLTQLRLTCLDRHPEDDPKIVETWV